MLRAMGPPPVVGTAKRLDLSRASVQQTTPGIQLREGEVTRAARTTKAKATKLKTAPPRAWQRMLSGRRLDLLDPSPLDIEIEDIAHGLARVARWNGQTRGAHAFSVAQHSVVVEDVFARLMPQAETRWRLAALIHDAPEYVIGDMISPFKAQLGGGYKEIEKRLEAAVHRRFGLPEAPPAKIARTIKQADHVSAYHEAVQIAGFDPVEAAKFFGDPGEDLQLVIDPVPTTRAQEMFLERFRALFAGA
jgi:5'-deoxynucleotidase YfbR-like HD superfamily hydrolase